MSLFLVASLGGERAWAELRPPRPINLETGVDLYTAGNGIVKDARWAAILGKALFWDVQVGSAGAACASCHFSAGADSRVVNQLNPGFNQQPEGDLAFGATLTYDGEPVEGAVPGLTKSQAEAGNTSPLDATYSLVPEDFPLHHLEDYKDRNSKILLTTNDVVSSSGTFDALFVRSRGRKGRERCRKPDGSVFHGGEFAARQVPPRNTPSTVNAVFNLLNFWDGRAHDEFNGVGVFGPRDIAGDPDRRLVLLDAQGAPRLSYLRVKHASLASQAVGPPLSDVEMSCGEKTFADLGAKLLATRRPLSQQRIAPDDSLFGASGPFGNLIHRSGRGLSLSYEELIQNAFEPSLWAAADTYRIAEGALVTSTKRNAPKGFHRQAALNFTAFWGLSVLLYEATLVSDQSKFDTWFGHCRPRVLPNTVAPLAVPIADPAVQCQSGDPDPTAAEHGGFTAQEVLGFALFNNGGVGIRNPGSPACGGCHPVTNSAAEPLVYPVFSEAMFQDGQTLVPVERSRIDLPNPAAELAQNCVADPANPGAPPRCGGVHDRGFFNIGVTPTSFDLGIGGLDPYGHPLSKARMFLAEQAGLAVTDPTGLGNRCATPGLVEPGGTPGFPGCPVTPPALPPLLDATKELELVDGTFKTPTTRNIGLTAPYFHNGGYAKLRQVVEFYARGGSRRDKALAQAGATGDTSGSGPLGKGPVPATGPDFGTNVDFFVRDVKSTEAQIDALVAFMLTQTDDRVRCDRAPFDHPELPIFDGHTPTDANGDRKADDVWRLLPSVGAGGYDEAMCLPNTGDLFDPKLRARLPLITP